MRFSFFCVVLLLLITACNSASMPESTTAIPIDSISTVDPNDNRMAAAQYNYNLMCAHCHGYGGEGQTSASIEQTLALGYHTVPLHNAEGHTWQHPSQVLFETIKYGVENPTSLYVMTPFEGYLSNEEIFAIIDYISLWWTDEQRTWQAQLTEKFRENNPLWEETNLESEEN